MIASIENAILARLKAAGDADVLGYKFEVLETYPEDWDEYLKAKRVQKWPGAWVFFLGWRDAEESSAGKVHVVGDFGLVVAARNLRNETATRHGDGSGKVGSYQLLVDAVALLAGQKLGLDIDRIRIGAARSVRPTETMQSLSLSAFAVELAIGVTLEGSDFGDDAIGDFETFHANWDVPPFVPIVAVPDDAAADATDHVTLEIAP